MWDPAEVFWFRVLACSCVFLRPTRTYTGYKHKNLKGKNLKGKNLKGKNCWKARTWHKSKANPQGHVTFTTMPFATLLRRSCTLCVCVAFVVFVLLFVTFCNVFFCFVVTLWHPFCCKHIKKRIMLLSGSAFDSVHWALHHAVGNWSVSYTHLTLPTKLEV